MSRQFFKIFSLALLAVVVVLGATAGLNGGGGGGGNQDIPLKATFSAGPFGPYGSYGYLVGKFRNDKTDPYVHQGTKSGMNQILISQPATMGRFLFVIYAASGRYLNLHLDTVLYPPVAIGDLPPECDCLQPYFIYPNIISPIQTTMISISTTWECQYISHNDETGSWAELIPIPKQYFNFAKMSPGETKYACGRGNIIQFRTTDDPNTTNYDESLDMYNLYQEPQFFVVKAIGNQGGITEWIITPFAERFKAKDHDGIYQDYPYGCVPRRVVSSAYASCNHGTFLMPFELKIARMK
jgi:hypothetical protein